MASTYYDSKTLHASRKKHFDACIFHMFGSWLTVRQFQKAEWTPFLGCLMYSSNYHYVDIPNVIPYRQALQTNLIFH